MAEVSVGSYYRRVFTRGWRDARAAIDRAGIVVGLLLALGAGLVQWRIDEQFDFTASALAAVVAAVGISIVFVAWHVFRAPMMLADETRREFQKQRDDARAEADRKHASFASELAARDATIAAQEAALDPEVPKALLMQQLVKSDDLNPKLHLRRKESDEEQAARALAQTEEIARWDRETRAILTQHLPQYRDDLYTGGTRVAPGLLARVSHGRLPPPDDKELRAFLAQRRKTLSAIIRML